MLHVSPASGLVIPTTLHGMIGIFFGMQIDAVAKSRDGKFRMVSNDEREQTLNQLLTVSSIPLTLVILSNVKN
jgi:hypothetical protein